MPEIPGDLVGAWAMFSDLSASRPPSAFGGIAPIPPPYMFAYMDEIGIEDPDERISMMRLVQSIDEQFRALANSKTTPEDNNR